VYVTGGGSDAVYVIDPEARAVVDSVAVGRRPWGIALSPDGTRLYTANGVSDDVSVVDLSSSREIARIPVGRGPWGIAISGS
jgi:YVTN family beta-propeller protein